MDHGKDRVQTEQVIDTVSMATQTDRVSVNLIFLRSNAFI